MNCAESQVDKVIVYTLHEILHFVSSCDNADQEMPYFHSTTTSTVKTRREGW